MVLSLMVFAAAAAGAAASKPVGTAVPVLLLAVAAAGPGILAGLLAVVYAALACYRAAALMQTQRWSPVSSPLQPAVALGLACACTVLLALRGLSLYEAPMSWLDMSSLVAVAAATMELVPLADVAAPGDRRTALAMVSLYGAGGVCAAVAAMLVLFSRAPDALFAVAMLLGAGYVFAVAGAAYVDVYYRDRNATYAMKDRVTRKRKVVVIGAGPSGLAYCKELVNLGQEVVVLEENRAVGGVFSTCYEDAILTTSTLQVQYSSFEEGINKPLFWTAREYAQYMHRYAERFGLYQYIRFGAKEVHITVSEKADASYPYAVTVTYEDEDGTKHEEVADHCIMCTGSNQKMAQLPVFENMDAFTGEVIHTSSFEKGHDFAGKKVAIIGCGESATDLSLLVAEHADKVYVSSRHFTESGWFVPRYYFGHVSDLDTSWVHHALPKWFIRLHDHYSMYPIWAMGLLFNKPEWVLWAKWTISKNVSSLETYGVKNLSLASAIAHHGAEMIPTVTGMHEKGVVCADGSKRDVDVVILAVGFKVCFSHFVTAPMMDLCPIDRVEELFLHSLDPASHPHFPIIPGGFSRPHFGAIPPLAEIQARYVSAVIAGAVDPPSVPEMQADIKDWIAERRRTFGEHTSTRVRALVEPVPYSSRIAARLGCDPPLFYFALRQPAFWVWLMMGSLVQTRFRLVGPDADPEEATRAIWQHRLSYMSLLHGPAMLALYVVHLAGLDVKLEPSIVSNHKA